MVDVVRELSMSNAGPARLAAMCFEYGQFIVIILLEILVRKPSHVVLQHDLVQPGNSPCF
jgi:hypothetical protein